MSTLVKNEREREREQVWVRGVPMQGGTGKVGQSGDLATALHGYDGGA